MTQGKISWLVTQSGGTYFLQMTGIRHNGERNTFAFKHLLDESDGTSPEQKLLNRLAHRRNKGLNPKPAGEGILSRGFKYGKLKPDANTAVDLSMIHLRQVLLCFVRALRHASWVSNKAHVTVTFPEACVKTADTAGNIRASDTIRVSAERVGDHIVEVYHCIG